MSPEVFDKISEEIRDASSKENMQCKIVIMNYNTREPVFGDTINNCFIDCNSLLFNLHEHL